MATRADFYIQHTDGKLELLGCTSNAYDGDFEKAKTVGQFRKAVGELLIENNSLPGKWYWPWKTSHITDEVFVFKHTPSFFNKDKGKLLSKVYVRDVSDDFLYFSDYEERYNRELFNEETGLFDISRAQLIQLPIFN
ncbi:hypothetical protein ACFS5N_16360 [Mucilaginibacter ximonensis]|uniref:Uncharacterized protein n=1 Tax=Mucilaginibacter ximonensis TaxID=538021 RepID=A0ABW5YFJ3_9SPHI